MAIQIKKGTGPFRDQRLCLMGLVYSVFAFCQWLLSHFGDLYKDFVNTGPNFASFVFLSCIFIFPWGEGAAPHPAWLRPATLSQERVMRRVC